MRFPGTWSRYSKNAIPQLTSAATIQGLSCRFLRCAYQAKVMKVFEQISSRVVLRTAGTRIPPQVSGDAAARRAVSRQQGAQMRQIANIPIMNLIRR